MALHLISWHLAVDADWPVRHFRTASNSLSLLKGGEGIVSRERTGNVPSPRQRVIPCRIDHSLEVGNTVWLSVEASLRAREGVQGARSGNATRRRPRRSDLS